MIIIMCPINGLKGQQAHSPRLDLGHRTCNNTDLKEQKIHRQALLLSFQGGGCSSFHPVRCPGLIALAPSGRYRVFPDNHKNHLSVFKKLCTFAALSELGQCHNLNKT